MLPSLAYFIHATLASIATSERFYIVACVIQDWHICQNETHLMNIFPELQSCKTDKCQVCCRL